MQLFVHRLGSLAGLAAAQLLKLSADQWRKARRESGAVVTAIDSDTSYDRVISKRDVGRWFQEAKEVRMADTDIVLIDTNYTDEEILTFANKFRSVFLFDNQRRFDPETRPKNIGESYWRSGNEENYSIIHLVCQCIGIDYDKLHPLYHHVAIADTHNAIEERLREAQSFVMGYRHYYENNSEGFEGLVDNTPESLEIIMAEVMKTGEEFRHQADDDIRRVFDARPKRLVSLAGFKVPIMNLQKRLVSLAYGPTLYQQWKFVVFYEDLGSHRHFELRTVHEDINLKEIAERFKGGGRRMAAGFTIPIEMAYKQGLY